MDEDLCDVFGNYIGLDLDGEDDQTSILMPWCESLIRW
jgi:hypothetical protein